MCVREAIQKKDFGFICFDPHPPPPNKDIKNKDILLNYNLRQQIWQSVLLCDLNECLSSTDRDYFDLQRFNIR